MTNSIQTNIQNIQNNLNHRRGLDSTGNMTANMTGTTMVQQQPNHQFIVSGSSAPEHGEPDVNGRSMHSEMENTNCNVTASLNDIDLKSVRNTLANYELSSQSKERKFTQQQ